MTDETCPVCGQSFIKQTNGTRWDLYIHEYRDGPMGTNIIEDACKHTEGG